MKNKKKIRNTYLDEINDVINQIKKYYQFSVCN